VKVWVVREDDYESQQIFAVCASPEVAEAEAVRASAELYGVVVEEFEVLDTPRD
jgi:hypothetical protein